MDKYNTFREKYPEFIYKSYKITDKKESVYVEFDFSIPELADFHPSWIFPKSEEKNFADDPIFEKLVFSLGMAEAVSYWKAVCSPVMRAECGELSAEQAEWWKKLYFNGLGEFFYVNGIDSNFDDFVKIISAGDFKAKGSSLTSELSGCLVPVGGGKDSALTLETLINSGADCLCYSINRRNSMVKTAETAGLPPESLITARRNFDRSLIDLNSRGFLNGHTPFSSVVAFSAEITAYIQRRKYIVLSNESSANESTVSGKNVNHQYSKSFEFEKDFHLYEEKYLNTGVYYFSFLRPLSEFQIAKMFASHRKYIPVFRSCNLGGKVSPDVWCADCSKCLFVCLILSPFLTAGELAEIFGKDLLNDVSMSKYFSELTGNSEHKPFECVGSIDEVNLAVSLAIHNIENSGGEMPFLFKEYIKSDFYHPENLTAKNAEYCEYFDENNLLPEDFKSILLNEMERIL